MRSILWAMSACLFPIVLAAQEVPLELPGTTRLDFDKPLDVIMVEGLDRFCLNEIAAARDARESRWKRDFASPTAYQQSLAPYREKFRTIIGAVDERVTPVRFARSLDDLPIQATTNDSTSPNYTVMRNEWPSLPGITADGLVLIPNLKPWKGMVVVIPDARWSPDLLTGAAPGNEPPLSEVPQSLASQGFLVVVPTLISRDDDFSGNPDIAMTNQSHREWVYRSSFELGRHVIGYEVQKVLAAVDLLSDLNVETKQSLPIVIAGVGDGAQIALYTAALDERIQSVMVSGYFQPRESVWEEPIDRNVWQLLTDFGDAEIAGMIAPRRLVIEACSVPVTDGPLSTKPKRRTSAAPGSIKIAEVSAVQSEYRRAKEIYKKLNADNQIQLVISGADGKGRHGCDAAISAFAEPYGWKPFQSLKPDAYAKLKQPIDRLSVQKKQVNEAIDYTQKLLRSSYKTRDRLFAKADRTSVEKWVDSVESLRDQVYRELIGKLPDPTMPSNPRSRKILETGDYTGYEVALDTYPDVIAGGILLLPKGMKPGEKRPVVVCQHGLEGVPMDTISGPDTEGYKYYKSFAAELAKRGFITYAPQNPYRGKDLFRTLQRKSNPLGRSLFSYIIPQHQVTLNWLATLPNVDANRIAFYGLSYGGKTAVRVPPLLPPRADRPGYCLSICSADFNEWVAKNASTDLPFAYVFTMEYEIFEWNMGHVANYAELSMLMTPRPFMVERGHDDGVSLDEWVAYEYAKVRRHYSKLGIGDKTEIEFFNGPHTINGEGTFAFLSKHLDWPARP